MQLRCVELELLELVVAYERRASRQGLLDERRPLDLIAPREVELVELRGNQEGRGRCNCGAAARASARVSEGVVPWSGMRSQQGTDSRSLHHKPRGIGE